MMITQELQCRCGQARLTLNVAHHHAYVFHVLQHEKADTLGRKKFPRNHHIVELDA
jgi:hypothetical protein